MYDCLDLFAEPTRAWFRHAFGEPTAAQRGAWPAIRSGRDTLVVAPTGSGKTLAAFLSAIDRLMRRGTDEDGGNAKAPRGVTVLYVSPLKALAVDVAKNLERPLDGIGEACRERGLAAPDIRVATRSGDTDPRARRAIASHPPDILVTTPESLYLMLTSKARRVLKTVDTVIVDEVHALAGGKRGAHLALSLERLDALAGKPAQRIGLSATVNPPSEAARFLGGARPVTVVDAGEGPAMDLKVVEPLENMRDLQSANAPRRAGGAEGTTGGSARPRISGVTPAMQRLAERRGLVPEREDSTDLVGAAGDRTGGSIWPVVERSVLDEVLAHRTTLVFVNSRGLAERLTARLNDLYAERLGHGAAKGSPEGREGFSGHYDAVVGSTTMLVGSPAPEDAIAMAHHGSVSKDRRKQIEERLKSGRLRCVVATSSLELGIDMGSVDLVIQIAPPLSVASGLQRVGRADHRVGGVSHALFYPLTREQIIGVAAGIEGMRAGDLEPLAVPRNPLDILAQQTVAAAAMDDLKPDDWYATVRRAAPFAELDREAFDAVMGMMTGVYNTEEFSAFRPPLAWNRDDDVISARPGAQRLAVTSGGTIPDRGLYTVVLPEADAGRGPRRVGELDEEMVYESRVGDVITLGTSTWQIQEITRDRVVVTPAPGRTARLPFWHGEGAGRDAGFGRARGRFVREVARGLVVGGGGGGGGDENGGGTGKPRFDAATERRLAGDGLDANAVANLARLLAEQRASTGVVPNDRELVVERCPDEEGDWRVIVHSPYGRRVHEPWAMAISNRIKQRYGFDGQAYAADDGIVLRLPEGESGIPVRDLLLFDPDGLRRAIETQVGESVLFAARFRECAARSLFLPRTDPGRRVPLWQQRLRAAQLLNAARLKRNFPLLLETARECLQDVYDLPALDRLMRDLNSGSVGLHDVETQTPSPLAENLLFGFVGAVMYQYDVPQAERSAQLLSVDPEVLERLLGGTDMTTVLDPDAIRDVEERLAGRTFWNDLAADDVAGRVARYAKTHGPFTADRLIADLELPADDAVHALDELAARGELMRGTFVADHGDGGTGAEGSGAADARQWLYRDVFARIRSLSLAKARKAVKPVEPAAYQAFLLDRQGVGPVGGERYEGADGLMRVIEQLEGVALPADVWENAVFPARVADYAPAMLDELLAGGEAVWVGSDGTDASTRDDEGSARRSRSHSRSRSAQAAATGRVAFYPADSPLIPVEGAGAPDDTEESELTIPDAIGAVLASGGAYHAGQLETLARERWKDAPGNELVDPATGEIQPPQAWSRDQFAQALWSLVWRGKVTNSSFAPVRAACTPTRSVRAPARAARRRVRLRGAEPLPMTLTGLWSAVGPSSDSGSGMPEANGDDAPERLLIARAETLLDRYGVIAQPLVNREDLPGGFSALYPVLRRMEEHGLLTRGMFVRGFGAAQFAAKDTVDALRDAKQWHSESNVALDAVDPANLTGAAVAWPPIHGTEDHTAAKPAKPVRRAGTIVVLAQGGPVLYAAPRSHRLLAFDRREDALRPACAELAYTLQRRGEGATFADLNGEPLTRRGDATRILHAAGFTPCPQGMKLYR
ncbi:DEAD/DEAH box helicase [Bifidobacterium avesanii]|uniref:DEAD/DEAH box helicase n=1 Tax=Bifidobacterium avesanii TaxID=1798157 RepID=A0A7K3TJN2_9BIFI|nr:DEAD/DEAH box helicase [Bifidobacterium avesanii]KAB8288518.1 DEAD/DEAH box helicase [Bifidobacterium avesanii]NEG79242.1 DEAD/DEAH box helicase [Bifidobacterium avesanii]